MTDRDFGVSAAKTFFLSFVIFSVFCKVLMFCFVFYCFFGLFLFIFLIVLEEKNVDTMNYLKIYLFVM